MHASGIQRAGRRVWLGLAVFVAALLAVGAIEAQETELKIGDWYRLGIQRGAVARSHEGTLIKVTDHWLVLNSVNRYESKQGVPYLSNLPGAGKWFSRQTPLRGDSDWWIPRDAASMQAHRKASDNAEVKSLDAMEPPIRRAYMVEMVAKGKLVEGQRDLLKVKGDTLMFGPSNASPTPLEFVNRRDIVSLRCTQFKRIVDK